MAQTTNQMTERLDTAMVTGTLRHPTPDVQAQVGMPWGPKVVFPDLGAGVFFPPNDHEIRETNYNN